jgi:hypothetical protein
VIHVKLLQCLSSSMHQAGTLEGEMQTIVDAATRRATSPNRLSVYSHKFLHCRKVKVGALSPAPGRRRRP